MSDLEQVRKIGEEAEEYGLESGERYYQGVEDMARWVVSRHVGSRKFARLLGAIEAKRRGLPDRSDPHDYVPGEDRHPMHTDPLCGVCRQAKH